LPSWGDTPVDPHSAFTHLKNYHIDGGLVDGPVYGSIYNNLIGITLYQPDEYAEFQSDLAVYHDDYGDYSTNEPTMDGTASLIYLLAAKEGESDRGKLKNFSFSHGAINRGDTAQKKIALVFTGDEFADGGNFIAETLRKEEIKASFFFTGRFYRNKIFKTIVTQLKKEGHYLGAHSNEHLLYCDWTNRNSLLVNREQFTVDLLRNYKEFEKLGIKKDQASYFLPPYEWYNDSISLWTNQLGLELINFTPGTKSTADYTYPGLKNYHNSESIYKSIIDLEKNSKSGLNGFILLLHIGTDPRRTDKFYHHLPRMMKYLHTKGYQFQTVNQLLKP
ncbi:MAG: polysaccharide deacetylase family protein, partial [Chitinophagaceae bacterium]